MLVTLKELLLKAKQEAYAVGSFNINNLESLLAVTEGALEEKSPVIVSVTPSAIRYAGLENLSTLVKTVAERVPIPVCFHLDHGIDLTTIKQCIEAGFSSVMIDGSSLNFPENSFLTRYAVKLAHTKGVSVEAELGSLRSIEEKEAFLTDPRETKEFIRQTGVDALAVAIGTSHGAYKFKGEPKLDFDRLRLIREEVDIPLVLHGASSVPSWIIKKAIKYGAELSGAKGIPEEDIRKAISLGITKINIDTDLRLAFTTSIREYLVNNPKEFDPRKILSSGKEAMKEVVREKILLFGSSDKV